MSDRRVCRVITCLCIGIALGWLDLADAFAEEMPKHPVKLESGLYYTVEKGDTLWDLSDHFYDSPWIWPDLWERNEEILNPHWIYPGEEVRIYSREELEKLFGHGHAWKSEPEPVSPPPEPKYYFYPAIDSVGFIREEPVHPSGAIFKARDNKETIGDRDTVYMKPMGDVAFKPGDRFTVFRTFKRLEDKEAKKPIGTQHYFVGVVEINDVHPNYSTGRIVTSYRDIELGDLMMPYEPRSPRIMLAQGKAGMEGKIIVSEEGQTIFAEHSIAFIDRGRKDGIQVGQSYAVYYQEKERIDPRGKEEVLLAPVDFARILILLTEETTATALVTYSEKSVHPGARVHTASP